MDKSVESNDPRSKNYPDLFVEFYSRRLGGIQHMKKSKSN